MIFVITIISCFIISCFFKDTRFVGFIMMLNLAFLVGNTDPIMTTDYQVYLNHYNILGMEVSPFEHGYTLMSSFFFRQGYSYAQFRMIFSITSFVILFVGVSLFTKKVALFTGIYGVTVFFNDATQIRNLMMISLVILGAGLLVKNSKALNALGVLSMILSTQFHDLGFVFLIIIVPLSFVKVDLVKKYFNQIVVTFFAIGILFMTINTNVIVELFSKFLSKFSSRTDSATNILARFGRGTSWTTIILVWISLILFAIVLKILVKSLDYQNLKSVKISMIGSGIALLTIFLIVIAPDYSRIARNSFLFLIILFCVFIEKKGDIIFNKNNILKAILILSLFTVTAYVHTTIWGDSYVQSIPYIANLR